MSCLQNNELIIEEIIKYVNIIDKLRFRGVCRKWFSLIERNLIRSRVFSNIDSTHPGYYNSICSNTNHHIVDSDTIGYSWKYDAEKFSLLLSKVFIHFNQLSALYLHNLTVLTNQLPLLADAPFCGTTLAHFSLTACDLKQVTRREWNYFCSKISQSLIHLTLYRNKYMNRDNLFTVRRYCTNLQEINYDLHEIDAALNDLIPSNLIKLHAHNLIVPVARLKHMFSDPLSHQHDLVHLRLPCILLYYNHLKTICTTLKKLKCLEITLIGDYHDYETETGTIIGNLVSLESFTLLSCLHQGLGTNLVPPNVDKLVGQLAQKRSNQLKTLKIGPYGLTKESLIELTLNCHNLEEFHYFHNDRCGYWVHRYYTIINHYLDDDSGKYLAQIKSLITLNISFSRISDAQIANIIRNCPNLRRLHLDNCKFAGPESFEAFIDAARQSPNQHFHLNLGCLNEVMAHNKMKLHKLQKPNNLNCDFFHQDMDIDVFY